jgi:hypothetical protein
MLRSFSTRRARLTIIRAAPVGETLLHSRRTDVPDRVLGTGGLGRAGRASLRAFAEALFSEAGRPPPADRLDWLVDDFDDFLRQGGARARLGFKALLLVVSVVAPVTVWRLLPLRALPLATRIEALERFERTPAGLAIYALKALVCLVYYEHPDAARSIGYEGTCKTGPHAPEPPA